MKKILRTFLLFTFALTLFSCDDGKDREIQIFELTVASVERIQFISDHHEPYFVKYKGQDEWKSFPYIEGFSHTEGYEYKIKVRKERVIFEDIYGVSLYEIKLLEEISKTRKDSENIPLQRGWLSVGSQKTGDEEYPYYVLMEGEKRKFPPIEGFEYEERATNTI